MTKTSIKKNVILNTLYQVLLVVVPLITAPYVARVLGPDGVGTYSYMSSIMLYFTMFAALGTNSYGSREISRNRDDAKKRSKLFWEIELLTIATSLISLILWCVVIAFGNENRIYYIILTMNLLNTMFDVSWFYAGIEEFKYTIMQNSIFKIIGIVLLFIFVKSPTDLPIYFLIMCSTTLLGTMTMWIYLKKFLVKVEVKKLNVFCHLKETIIYFIPTIATSIYTVLDKTLIGLITQNDSENGFYEEANKIINIMKALTFTSLNTVFGSRIAYLFQEKKTDEIHQRIDQSINYILAMGLGICFGLIAMANRFIPWFLGEGFDKTITILQMMSPLIVIVGISNCLGSQFFTPAGYRKESAKYIIIGSVINLILNLCLIPKFWGYGAVVASIIAELSITILYLKHSRGYLTGKKVIKFGWKKLVAAVVMLVIIMILDGIITNDIMAIIIEFLVGTMTYGAILFALKDEFLIGMKDILTAKLKGAK